MFDAVSLQVAPGQGSRSPGSSGFPFVLSTIAKWACGLVSAAFHVASDMRKPTVTMMLHLSAMNPLMYLT